MSNPDQNIFPHATGVAAKTVEQHQEPQDLVFYSGWFCPYVQRTWITLEERGIPYQYKEVNPYKKEKHFLEINPKGLVPAVEYKGKALYESLILCEFLEDAFPTHAPHILPADPHTRALVRIWVDHVNKQIVPAFMRTVMAQEPAAQRSMLDEFNAALRTLCAAKAALAGVHGGAAGPYFLGAEFSLVDVAIAPWACRDYILKENRGYTREEVGEDWVRYAEALEGRESVKRTCSERQHYAEIYARYLRNEAQSEAAKAIRAGRAF